MTTTRTVATRPDDLGGIEKISAEDRTSLREPSTAPARTSSSQRHEDRSPHISAVMDVTITRNGRLQEMLAERPVPAEMEARARGCRRGVP